MSNHDSNYLKAKSSVKIYVIQIAENKFKCKSHLRKIEQSTLAHD
eukprot:UN09381